MYVFQKSIFMPISINVSLYLMFFDNYMPLYAYMHHIYKYLHIRLWVFLIKWEFFSQVLNDTTQIQKQDSLTFCNHYGGGVNAEKKYKEQPFKYYLLNKSNLSVIKKKVIMGWNICFLQKITPYKMRMQVELLLKVSAGDDESMKLLFYFSKFQ